MKPSFESVEHSSAASTDAPRSASSSLRGIAVRLGRGGCIVAALALGIGELAGAYWPFVLVTPHTPQWGAIAILGVLLLAFGTAGRRTSVDRICLVFGLAAFVYGGAITFGRVPWRTLPPADRVAPGDADFGRIKVMTANVHTENSDHQTILKVIAEEDPDIILLPEVDDAWAEALRPLNATYKVHRMLPQNLYNFGIAFYSRLPGSADWFTAKAAGQDDAFAVPQIDARLILTDRDGRAHPIRFLGLHPLPPIKAGNTFARDAVLAEVARRVGDRMPAIVAGDLNATRYCRVVQSTLRPAGLSDAASPLRFSWPNTWSWWAMVIRIDHVLASDAWRVVDIHTGRDIHSDHLPIVATLQLVH